MWLGQGLLKIYPDFSEKSFEFIYPQLSSLKICLKVASDVCWAWSDSKLSVPILIPISQSFLSTI